MQASVLLSPSTLVPPAAPADPAAPAFVSPPWLVPPPTLVAPPFAAPAPADPAVPVLGLLLELDVHALTHSASAQTPNPNPANCPIVRAYDSLRPERSASVRRAELAEQFLGVIYILQQK